MQPMQSEKIDEISKALAKAQGEFKSPKMDATNPHFKNKYASLSSLLEATRGALSQNELAIVQYPMVLESGQVVLFTRLSHSSGQWMLGNYPVQPDRGGPQAMGSCMTYARRYSYQSMLGICGEGDDDAEGATVHKEGNSKPRKYPEKKPDPPSPPLAVVENPEQERMLLVNEIAKLITKNNLSPTQLNEWTGVSSIKGITDLFTLQGILGDLKSHLQEIA